MAFKLQHGMLNNCHASLEYLRGLHCASCSPTSLLDPIDLRLKHAPWACNMRFIHQLWKSIVSIICININIESKRTFLFLLPSGTWLVSTVFRMATAASMPSNAAVLNL